MTPELVEFLASIVLGALCMLLWDALGAIRLTLHAGALLNALFDIAWWVLSASALCIVSAKTNNMQLRAFVFIALLGGGFLYHITLSTPLKKLFCVLIDTIFKILGIIFKILLTPGHFLYKILLRVFIKSPDYGSMKGGRNGTSKF